MPEISYTEEESDFALQQRVLAALIEQVLEVHGKQLDILANRYGVMRIRITLKR